MRFNYFSAGNAVWRTLLALMLLTSPGCAQITQPSEGATPPAEQPAYAALAANIFPKPWRIGSPRVKLNSQANFQFSALYP